MKKVRCFKHISPGVSSGRVPASSKSPRRRRRPGPRRARLPGVRACGCFFVQPLRRTRSLRASRAKARVSRFPLARPPCPPLVGIFGRGVVDNFLRRPFRRPLSRFVVRFPVVGDTWNSEHLRHPPALFVPPFRDFRPFRKKFFIFVLTVRPTELRTHVTTRFGRGRNGKTWKQSGTKHWTT
jgi:hypothetical protein